jgi:hypothetical protein
MALIKTFTTINGSKYKVFLTKEFPKGESSDIDDGICFEPVNGEAAIYIDDRLGKDRLAEVIIHEIAHAFFWQASEERVEKFAKVVADTLKKQGFIK